MHKDESVNTRERVLTEIRTASTPPTVDDLASSLDLHRNSVRLHTAALRKVGLVQQEGRATGGRGRPVVVYRPTDRGVRAGGRNYELLATVLVDHLATTEEDPEEAAKEAGRAWGSRLADGRRRGRALVSSVLADLGFEPDRGETVIELRNCPFAELVDTHQGLVCSLHAGMLEGLVEGETAEVNLVPFTTPTTCSVTVE